MARNVSVKLVLTESAGGKVDIDVQMPLPGADAERLKNVAMLMVAHARNPLLLANPPKIGEVSVSCAVPGGSRIKRSLGAGRS